MPIMYPVLRAIKHDGRFYGPKSHPSAKDSRAGGAIPSSDIDEKSADRLIEQGILGEPYDTEDAPRKSAKGSKKQLEDKQPEGEQQ